MPGIAKLGYVASKLTELVVFWELPGIAKRVYIARQRRICASGI